MSLMEKPSLKVSTKLKEALSIAFERMEERLRTEQRTISHARRVSKAQERSMSEEGKKKRKMDQLRQLTEGEQDLDYPVSSVSNSPATTTSPKISNHVEQKQSTTTRKEKRSAGSSIVSSVASSEDSSVSGATGDRGRLLTSITSFEKNRLKNADTDDRSAPLL